MGAAGVTVKVSDDGQNFKEVASKVIPSLGKDDKDGLYPQEISFDPVKARYVEVIIKSDSRHGTEVQVIRRSCLWTKSICNK